MTKGERYMEKKICCCGHDCSRCVTYLATVREDEALRKQSQAFYRETFGIELPPDEIRCLGIDSDCVLSLCRECPWVKCCREKGIGACEECAEYPCEALAAYRERYVNRCHIL